MAKDLNRNLPKENISMANKHMKQYPKSLSLEKATKITVRHHLTSLRVPVT